MAVKIFSVAQNSHAQKHMINAGDTLLSINGNDIVDVLDYRFYQLEKNLTLEILTPQGQRRSVNIRKAEYDEIGLEFETYLMDKQRSCRNKCVFCFIDQLPKGLRKSLYFKDDDSRLSFLFGNYITLTNLTEHEINRIIKMHISPINISVHTTNPKLRVDMMGNRFAGESLEYLKRFSEAGIAVNCQIVACPGINDGSELEKTLTDLEALNVQMAAVVPVGLTAHREGLYPLEAYTEQTARETLEIVERFGEESKKKTGARRFFAGDEFYIKAKKPIPPAEFYEDFPALENGVGLIALLEDELSFELEQYEKNEAVKKRLTVACGTSAAIYMKKNVQKINEVFPNIKIEVVGVENRFFGGGVNVSGLVVGRDLINALKGRDLGEKLLIPSAMLNFDGDMFLDDTTLNDVIKELDIEVIPVHNNGKMLLDTILGEQAKK